MKTVRYLMMVVTLLLGFWIVMGILSPFDGNWRFLISFKFWVGLIVLICVRWVFKNLISAENEIPNEINKKLSEWGFQASIRADIRGGLNPIQLLADNTRKEFVIVENANIRKYPYSTLIKYELIENGTNYIEGNLIATAIGGLFAGITGAIIAGSLGRDSGRKVSQLDIRVTLNDPNNLSTTLPILSPILDVNTNGVAYKDAITCAKNAIAVLDYIAANK